MSRAPTFSSRTRILLAGLLFGLLSSQAWTQEQAPARRQVAVTPVNVLRHAPVQFRTGVDEPIPLPPHPPIDLIPPMPMPEEGSGQNGPTTMTWHNARTGETRELSQSVFRAEPDDAGQGGEGYHGIGEEDGTDEMMRGFGSMFAVAPATTWPRRGNCKLVMHFVDTGGTDRWFNCSGSMQDAGVVLTAAHCVYARNPNGINIFNWASEIYVYPGWDGVGPTTASPASDAVVQNWGWARGDSFLAGSAYVNNGDSDRDAGLVRLNDCDRSVGMLTGWFGWAHSGSCNTSRTYNNYSYPGESCSATLHTGRTMYFWGGNFDSCPGNGLRINTSAGCLTAGWGGMSGSGAYYTSGGYRYVHAVCSTSNRSTRSTYCKLWEQFVNDMQDFENATRTSTFDLESLMFRTIGGATIAADATLSDCSAQICNATNNNPSARDYILNVYLSTNNNISSSDTLLDSWFFSDVNFDDMECIQFNFPGPTIPSSTTPGTYWIGAELEPGTDASDCNNDTDTWDAQKITVFCERPQTPVNVIASENWSTRIRVTWLAGAYTDYYEVWRNTVNSTATATLIATTSSTSYNDYTATPGTVYYYWVKAKNDCGEQSGFSSSDTGERVIVYVYRYAVVGIYQLAPRQRAPEDCLQPGSGTNDILTVSLDMSGAPVPIVGGQFFLEYDNSVLDFISAVPGEPPFTREIYADVDEGTGTIDYVTGIEDGDDGTTADKQLAILIFRVVADECGSTTSVAFRNHFPPSRLGDEDDGEVLLVGENLLPIGFDGTPPELTVPPAISVNADAGECQATFTTLPMATATDNCDPQVDVSFTRSDGKTGLLDPYEATDSPIAIAWQAEDDCGNIATGAQVITVSGQTELLVDVELSPMLDDPQPTVPGDQLFRCITLEFWECPDGGAPSAVVEQVMGFSVDAGFPYRSYNVSVLIPCGTYTCATARDRLHTLRSTAPDFTDNGAAYSATFVGNPANDGHWLVGGNLNDDEFIDILDFASYIVRFGLVYGNRHTDCSTPFYHADITGDGLVWTGDFTFIAVNFLKFHEPDCCFDPTPDFPDIPGDDETEASRVVDRGPMTAISVRDLWRMGLGELSAADLNGDGVVDMADMTAFGRSVGMATHPGEPIGDGKRALRATKEDPAREIP